MQVDKALIEKICHRLLNHVKLFNDLDSKCGDGETGSNLSRGLLGIGQKIQESKSSISVKDLGMTLNSGGCGTLGTIWSFLLMKCEEAKTLPEALEILKTVFDKLSTGAKVGDKTMGDALLPWIEALQKGKGPREAADLARMGAEATSKMVGKFGRAKYAGERSLGTRDPGALATAIILDEVSRFMENSKGAPDEEVPQQA